MKEKARIDISILDLQTTEVDRALFAPVVRLDPFIDVRSRPDLVFLEEKAQIAIHSLNDLTKAMRIVLERHIADGAVGIKNGLALSKLLFAHEETTESVVPEQHLQVVMFPHGFPEKILAPVVKSKGIQGRPVGPEGAPVKIE